MARKSQSAPTPAPVPNPSVPLASKVSKSQPKAKSKAKKAKKGASQAQVTVGNARQTGSSKSPVQNGTGTNPTVEKGKKLEHGGKLPKTNPGSAISVLKKETHKATQNGAVNLPPVQKGKDNKTESSTSKIVLPVKISLSSPSSFVRRSMSVQSCETQNELADETFQLAASNPADITSTVERQFYESQLLLYVLGQVRGERRNRQNYHGELDQDDAELRRSFVDQLAYICDFKTGGTTVTALALQKTYQGIIFWLAANETVKPKVRDFLREVLGLLRDIEGSSKKAAETKLLALVVNFNKERLDFYWSHLKKSLPDGMKRLKALEITTNSNPTPKHIKMITNLLGNLLEFSGKRTELVKECFEARRSPVFETLAQLGTNGKVHCDFFSNIRHLLGRMGEHVRSTKTLVSTALRFPRILDEFQIRVHASPPFRCYFQSSDSIGLEDMASRIFTKEIEVKHYQEAIDKLQRVSNGALLDLLQQECHFKTRIHAELLLVDLFYWSKFDFLEDDPYVGCSKPACFSCYHYILAHPGNFVLPASHYKIYLSWRSPDILRDEVSPSTISRVREKITVKMNSSIRAELARQIDGKCSRNPARHDSITGTSTSIQGEVMDPLTNDCEDESDSEYASAGKDLASPEESQPQHQRNDIWATAESDDDLSWYQSRVESIQFSRRLSAAREAREEMNLNSSRIVIQGCTG